METNIFDSCNLISIISLLLTLRRAHDTCKIHEGTTPWKSPISMKKPDAGALNYPLSLLSKSNKRKMEGTLTSHCKVNYLLKTYTKDDIIAEIGAGIANYTPSSNMMFTELTKAVWNKTIRCKCDHREYGLKGIVMEGLHASILHSTYSYCSSRSFAAVHDFANQATYLTNLQYGSHLSITAHTRAKPNNCFENTKDRRSYQKSTAGAHAKADLETNSWQSHHRQLVPYWWWHCSFPTGVVVTACPCHGNPLPIMPPFCRLCLNKEYWNHLSFWCRSNSVRSHESAHC